MVTWAILVPILATLLGILIAQAVTVYIARSTQKAQLREAELRREGELARDLRSERVTQYAKLLTAARDLYALLEAMAPPNVNHVPTAATTSDLAMLLGPDFSKGVNALNQSTNAVRLLSGQTVREKVQGVEDLLRLSAVIRAYRGEVSSLPSFAESESELISAMTREVQPG